MQAPELDAKSRMLIDAMTALGEGWHSRAQIAAQIGKRQLNPTETTLLDLLTEQGRIERDTQQGSRVNLLQWVYRLKG